MREIKFRAWDKKENVMRTLVTVGCSRRDVWNPLYIDGGLINGFEHTDYEVMQYTGLHDKNGKEIYEGDIVKGQCFVNCSWNRIIGQVTFSFGRFCIDGIGRYKHFMRVELDSSYEVIGNVYENPDLVGGNNA